MSNLMLNVKTYLRFVITINTVFDLKQIYGCETKMKLEAYQLYG